MYCCSTNCRVPLLHVGRAAAGTEAPADDIHYQVGVEPSTAAQSWAAAAPGDMLRPAHVTVFVQTIAGPSIGVAVDPGEHVNTGQILARFDPLALGSIRAYFFSDHPTPSM